MSMIIGKKHIVLAALVVALAAAIFINYRMALPSENKAAATMANPAKSTTAAVSGTKSDFFATARLTRSQTRDEATQVLKTTLTSATATTAEKQKATETLNQIAKNIVTEGQIETLIKAKGFSECVCEIGTDGANIVVKPKTGATLSASDTAKIYDIVISQTKLSKASIKIIQQN